MKSTVSNLLSFKLALVSFILTGMFLFASTEVHAQVAVSSDMSIAPNGPYTTPSSALDRVREKVNSLKAQFEILTPGSQAYNDNSIKHTFYNSILDKLIDGKTVKESFQAGLTFLSTDVASSLGKTVIQATRQEAINLLKP